MFPEFLRSYLARRGIMCARLGQPVPPSCQERLHEIARAAFPPAYVLCLDNDEQIQTDVLELFPSTKVVFHTPFLPGSAPLTDPRSASQPRGPLLALVDIEAVDLERLAAESTWLFARDIRLFLRSSLGWFWNGRGDLAPLCRWLGQQGFALQDVLDYGVPGLLRAPSGRVTLQFEHHAAVESEETKINPRTARVHDALAYLSQPIARARDFALLAGRGSFGFSGGVLNPGAIIDGDQTVLVARGETAAWANNREDAAAFLRTCQPLLLHLDATGRLRTASPLAPIKAHEAGPARMEDFRLFRYRDRIFANHSILTLPEKAIATRRPVRLANLRTRVGISELDTRRGTLTFLGSPTIDRPLAAMEKNWAMLAHSDRLFLIYSFHPYRVYCTHDEPNGAFAPFLETELPLPFATSRAFRNSINPIDYDAGHFLHVVHQVHRGRDYVFWAVLIDKETLLPTHISLRPLARASQSTSCSLLYLCSAIAEPAQVVFFAGLNDSSTGCWRIARSSLDAAWQPFGASADNPSSAGREMDADLGDARYRQGSAASPSAATT